MADGDERAIARNAACPCGSGRRYKDCHGALGGTPETSGGADSVDAMLAAALAAQRAGQLDDAKTRYEEVLGREPAHFDALHMLGVLHFQRHEFGRARELIARACVLRPDVLDARRNLRLVDNALRRADGGAAYRNWLARREPADTAARSPLWAAVAARPDAPRISLLLPTYNTPGRWLARCLDSVLGQVYPHWELCIADDASTDGETWRTISRYAVRDARIRAARRERNGHISAATNSALALARSPFVGLLDHDDELPAWALAEVALEIVAHPEAVLIYSDEDKIDEEGNRFEPYFKPDWNETLMRSQNAVSHLGVYRTDRLRAIGGFREGYEGAQDWDAALRIAEGVPVGAIRHIPRILYHWRSLATSTARSMDSKSYALAAQERTVAEHCAREGIAVQVSRAANGCFLQCDPAVESAGTATLIVMRRPWVPREGLAARWQARAGAAARETNVVDIAGDGDPQAGIDERPVALPGDGARALNAAAAAAGGEILVFVDGELQPRTGDAISLLVRHALASGVGAVGGISVDIQGCIAGTGYVLDSNAVAGSPYVGEAWGFGAMGARDQVVQEMAAVRLDCLAVRRDLWRAVGGLDTGLCRVFHDVDLCLRAAQAGRRHVWHPGAVFAWPRPLRVDVTADALRPEDRADADAMRARWGERLARDAAYNPNLEPVPRLFELAVSTR